MPTIGYREYGMELPTRGADLGPPINWLLLRHVYQLTGR